MKTCLSSRAWLRACFGLVVWGAMMGAGCSSSKPPPQPLPAQAAVQGTATTATKLSQSGQWPAAAGQWSRAADQYRLLNDLPHLAMALHNLAQAQSAQGMHDVARTNFEQAAVLNLSLARESEWWRNQIALLQVESLSSNSAPLQKRFEEVKERGLKLSDANLAGLFLNELGLWQARQDQVAEATESYAQAEIRFRQARDDYGIATVQANRADLLAQQKDFEAAVTEWDGALKKFEQLADPARITRALAGKGRALIDSGKGVAEGIALLERAAQNYRVLGDAPGERAALKALESARLQP